VQSHSGFEQVLHEKPRDIASRLIYADWLEEHGEKEAAQTQRLKAKQCARFDPDFDYTAYLKKLKVADKVQVERIAFDEIIRLTTRTEDCSDLDSDWLEEQGENEEGIERYYDSARLQAWLQEQMIERKRGHLSDANGALEWFWEHMPGARSSENVKGKHFATALQSAFEASKEPEDRKGRKTISRSVGKGYVVERTGRNKPSWRLKGGRVRQCVWSVFWDSGGSGAGAGTEEAYQIGERYYYTDSSSGYRSGPHDSLQTLLKETGLHWITEATVSIWCPLHSAEEILGMSEVSESMKEGYGLTINDEIWIWVTPGVLQRAEPEAEE